jgi:hypothetical protein
MDKSETTLKHRPQCLGQLEKFAASDNRMRDSRGQEESLTKREG